MFDFWIFCRLLTFLALRQLTEMEHLSKSTFDQYQGDFFYNNEKLAQRRWTNCHLTSTRFTCRVHWINNLKSTEIDDQKLIKVFVFVSVCVCVCPPTMFGFRRRICMKLRFFHMAGSEIDQQKKSDNRKIKSVENRIIV